MISQYKNLLHFNFYKYIRPFFIPGQSYSVSAGDSDHQVAVLTVAFNSCEIIELQYEFLKKYLSISFEYVLIDNSTDELISKRLKDFSLANHITYCKVNNNPYHWPSLSHGYALNIGIKVISELRASIKYLLVLDHDLLPFSRIDTTYFSSIAVKESDGKIFPWPGLIALEVQGLNWQKFDFRPVIEGGKIYDTGSALPDKLLAIGRQVPRVLVSKDAQSKNMQYDGVEIFDDTWLHVVNMSNWAPKDEELKSIDSIKNLITSLENKNDHVE